MNRIRNHDEVLAWTLSNCADGNRRWICEMQHHAVTELGDPDGVINVDDTSFPPKGTMSVGVQRQYAGCLGRVDNCPVGVFLNYLTPEGHVRLDRRLFLPEEWAKDSERRKEAGVPEDVVFRTKPELAWAMVRAACRFAGWAATVGMATVPSSRKECGSWAHGRCWRCRPACTCGCANRR